MAAGNHLEKGIWALLVRAANIIVIETIDENGVLHIDVMDQWP